MPVTSAMHLTFDLFFMLSVYELISLQHFSKPTPFVLGLAGLFRGTEWQVVIVVGLLWIIVRTDLVHPQPDRLSVLILQLRRETSSLSTPMSKVAAKRHRKSLDLGLYMRHTLWLCSSAFTTPTHAMQHRASALIPRRIPEGVIVQTILL